MEKAIENKVIELLESCGALLKGHFILRSGLRSKYYFQCARVGEDLEKVEKLVRLLIKKIGELEFDTVLAPAMGALVLGQEVARQLKKRFIFVEKEEGKLILRRGFTLKPEEKVLIVEDVVTRGGRAQESIDIVQAHKGIPMGLAVLVDRSEGNAKFNVPFYALLNMNFPTYEPQAIPEELKAIPPVKPGS